MMNLVRDLMLSLQVMIMIWYGNKTIKIEYGDRSDTLYLAFLDCAGQA